MNYDPNKIPPEEIRNNVDKLQKTKTLAELFKIPDLDCRDKLPDLLNSFGYESPITMIIQDIEMKMENDCVSAVQRYGFDINKEELKKALLYDRNQFEAGFEFARAQFERPRGEWIKILPEKRGYAEFFRCSVCLCNVHLGYWAKKCDYDYCPNCGAKMYESDEVEADD